MTVEVSGGGTESYLLDGLDSGAEYSMSVVALSPHLPSAVVGPVTPTGMCRVLLVLVSTSDRHVASCKQHTSYNIYNGINNFIMLSYSSVYHNGTCI